MDPEDTATGGVARPSLGQLLQRPQSSPDSVPWGPSWSPRGPLIPGHSSLGISPSATSSAASGPCSPGLPAKAFLSHCCHSLSLHFGELHKVIDHGCLSSWRDGAPGLTAAAARLAVAVGTGVVGCLESCVLPSLLSLGSLKLWALLPGQRARIAGTMAAVPSSVCYSPPTFRRANV